jgi:hypothetical protein
MDLLALLAGALHEHSVRFVLIGVAGANYYAQGGATLFTTEDRDVFLPSDPTGCSTSCSRNTQSAATRIGYSSRRTKEALNDLLRSDKTR